MIEDDLRRILNSPERTLPMWQDPAERIRAGMRRRFRRAVVSTSAVVLVLAGAGVAYVMTRPDTVQPQPTVAAGVVPWIDSPATASTPESLPPFAGDAELCASNDLNRMDMIEFSEDAIPHVLNFAIRARNVGAGPCKVSGRPELQEGVLARLGEGAFPGSTVEQGQDSIALRPGESAVAWLSFDTNSCQTPPPTGSFSVFFGVNGRSIDMSNAGAWATCPTRITGWSMDRSGPLSGLDGEVTGGSIKQGQDFVYFLELHNVTKAAIALEPCPVYTQVVQPTGPPPDRAQAIESSHRLNCDRASIGPGEVVRYEMRLPKVDLPVGQVSVIWSIPGGPTSYLYTTVRSG